MRPALAMAIVASVCALIAQPTGAAVPSLPPLHAEPDPVRGGRIVDARGREVLLRGVNVNALAEYWKGTRFPTVFPLARDDPGRMAAIGWNAVRLLVSWSQVEPRPGVYDRGYLALVDRAIARLRAAGIYTIVDLHQDAWGASLVARRGEVCTPPAIPALGWDGAPAWATLSGGAARCYVGDVRETSAAVVAAWDAFFDDDLGPGGVGIQTRYVRMLGVVARRFARTAGVAGIDVINEPGATSPGQAAQLSRLYARSVRSIRAGQRAVAGHPLLVLFEPSVLFSAIGSGAPPPFAHDRDVVYAPHIYTGGFTGGPITRAAFDVARAEARTFGGVPVLTGEWGADPDRAGPAGDGYFRDHQRLQDDQRFGAALWTWRESCGDPHKVADLRAGRVPEVWGEFEVDCTTNRITGERTHLIADLTRAYLRAAPGRIAATRYAPGTRTLVASGTAARRAGPLLAFYPRGVPRVQTRGLRHVRIARGPAGGWLVSAAPRGGAWRVSLQPGGSLDAFTGVAR